MWGRVGGAHTWSVSHIATLLHYVHNYVFIQPIFIVGYSGKLSWLLATGTSLEEEKVDSHLQQLFPVISLDVTIVLCIFCRR